MRKLVPLLNSAVLAIGGVLGLMVLHPVVMYYADTTTSRGPGKVTDALFAAFSGQMLPMMSAFAALGAAFAFSCLAVQAFVAKRAASPQAKPRTSLVRVCMYCKGIARRGSDGKDQWIPLEVALHESQGMEFTHGVCPPCYAAHFEPELQRLRRKKARDQGEVARFANRRGGSQRIDFG